MTHVSGRDNTPCRQAGGRQARAGGKPKHPERERGGNPGEAGNRRSHRPQGEKGGPNGLVPEPPKLGPGILPMEGH